MARLHCRIGAWRDGRATGLIREPPIRHFLSIYADYGAHDYFLAYHYTSIDYFEYFEGFGFTYDNSGTLWTGTITNYSFGWTDWILDYTVVEISDIAVPARSITNIALTASTADDQALFRAMLQGDDVITGDIANDYRRLWWR
jgi:hypothetical protein